LQFLYYPHEAKWTSFQTHYVSENLLAQGIEPETSGYVVRKYDQQTTKLIKDGLREPTQIQETTKYGI
jgi:hypothetical protein